MPLSDLHQAIIRGDLDRVRELIDEGADVNCRGEQGESSLGYAIRSGLGDMVRLLISAGAVPDESNVEAAIEMRAFRIASLLKEATRGTVPPQALLRAVRGGDVELVKGLVDTVGLSVLVRETDGCFALGLAESLHEASCRDKDGHPLAPGDARYAAIAAFLAQRYADLPLEQVAPVLFADVLGGSGEWPPNGKPEDVLWRLDGSAQPNALRVFAEIVNTQPAFDYGHRANEGNTGFMKRYQIEAMEGSGFILQETTDVAPAGPRILEKRAAVLLESILSINLVSENGFCDLRIELRRATRFEGYWVRLAVDPDRHLDLTPSQVIKRVVGITFSSQDVAKQCKDLLLTAIAPLYANHTTNKTLVGSRIRVD